MWLLHKVIGWEWAISRERSGSKQSSRYFRVVLFNFLFYWYAKYSRMFFHLFPSSQHRPPSSLPPWIFPFHLSESLNYRHGWAWSRGKHSSHLVEGVTSGMWSPALRCSGNCYFCCRWILLLEFALLLGSSVFRSSLHRMQFNLHLFSQSFTSWHWWNDYWSCG